MFQFSCFTSAGIRAQNEDTIFARENIFIIADGLGGHSDGKIASELAVSTLSKILLQEDPAVFVIGGQRMEESELMEAFLMDAVRQAGASVMEEARRRGSDMATTLTAVMIRGHKLFCTHVGDCALLLSEDGSLPLTRRTVEHRRGASLNRTLGGAEQVTPDFLEFDCSDQSVFLLGCDGFWEHLAEVEISRILEETPACALAERLVQAALTNGSQDNVSVVAVVGERFSSARAAHQVEIERARLDTLPASQDKETRLQVLREFAALHGVPVSNPLEDEIQALQAEVDHLKLELEEARRYDKVRTLQAEIARLNKMLEEADHNAELIRKDLLAQKNHNQEMSRSSQRMATVTRQALTYLVTLWKQFPAPIERNIPRAELEHLEKLLQSLNQTKANES